MSFSINKGKIYRMMRKFNHLLTGTLVKKSNIDYIPISSKFNHFLTIILVKNSILDYLTNSPMKDKGK